MALWGKVHTARQPKLECPIEAPWPRLDSVISQIASWKWSENMVLTVAGFSGGLGTFPANSYT